MPINTILFDLDDTLLGNDIRNFIPSYLKSFGAHVAPLIDPQRFVASVLAGTQAMLANTDPRRTLEQVFYETFYAQAGLPHGALREAAESFYAHQFPLLQSETSIVPGARAAVEWAFESGHKVVIATNALFPRPAILQRLSWAGVSADDFRYELITTLEHMHFAKPRPEYYAEILARVEARPEETIMVGNDWGQDIEPAATMGLHTWWVADSHSRPAGEARPFGIGPLTDFLNCVRALDECEALTPRPQSARAVRAEQAASLAVILNRSAAVSPAGWRRRPRESEWSLTEIACHLRDVEIEINQPRLERVLTDSNPFISAVDSDLWAEERDYQSQDGPAALQAFAEARLRTLALLDRLSPDEWRRPARHAVFGPTTLQELVSFTNEHDRLHLRQMREDLKTPML